MSLVQWFNFLSFVYIFTAFNYPCRISETWDVPQWKWEQVLNSRKFTPGSCLACNSGQFGQTSQLHESLISVADLQTGWRGCNEMSFIKANLIAFSIRSWGFDKQETISGWRLQMHLMFFNITVWMTVFL